MNKLIIFLLAVVIFGSAGCKKFVLVNGPVTSVSEKDAYGTDATAAAVLASIYTVMSQGNSNWSELGSFFSKAGLAADELTYYTTAINNQEVSYYTNNVTTANFDDWWGTCYGRIYIVNAAMDGMAASSTLSEAAKRQLTGEAKFLRAFHYYFLVNLYGDVPLVLTTNYRVNAVVPRSPVKDIYTQMIKDLTDAEELLSADYLDGAVRNVSTDRVRPTKWAAKALLARVYLYNGDWAMAVAKATEVIDAHQLYDINIGLDEVFLMNSKETIWAIPSVMSGEKTNTGEGRLFVLPATGLSADYPVYLSDLVLQDFEPGDQRKLEWVGETAGYHFPNKYKAGALVQTPVEYSIVLRLAEQYLIRAEAEIRLHNVAAGVADLNVLRDRATDKAAAPADQLTQLSASLSEEDALKAALHERRIELFTEYGHRWMDLKRTGTIDAVMATVTPMKGGLQWRPYQALLPIPQNEILVNPALEGHQNPGYAQ